MLLPRAVESFVIYLRAERSYAEKTITGMVNDIEMFGRRFPGDPEEWTRDHIRLFLSNTRWTAATKLVRFKSLQRFFSWMVEEEIIDRSPMAGMTPPKGAKKVRPPERLDERDMEILISVWPQRHWMGLRNRALLYCYFTMPFRLSELAHLQVQDVDLIRNTVRARKSKGNDHGYSATIFPKAALALDRYRRKLPDDYQGRPYLWIAQEGGPLQPHGLQQMLRRTEARAREEGFSKHIWSHGFRHMWGIQTVHWGLATDVAAQTMGQSTTDAAELYRKMAMEDAALSQIRRIAGLTA